MQIKAMIVDDEKLERILIMKSFNWGDNGFEIVAEADSGENAIDFALKYKLDIILTDINMPFMDGIEFVTWIRENLEDCKVIMITGYREFEYAQKAVKLGVEDFLLKPINKEDLCQTLLKVKKDIEQKQNLHLELSKLKSIQIENKEVLKESFLQLLVQGRIKEKEGLEKLKLYDMSNLLKTCQCINIKLHMKKDKQELLYEEKSKIIKFINRLETLSSRSTTFVHYMGSIIILYGESGKGSESAEELENLQGMLQCIKDKIQSQLQISITIGVGNRLEGIQGIIQSYKQSVNALTGSIIYGEGSILYFSELDGLQKQNTKIFSVDFKEFIFALENQLRDKVFEYVENYIYLIKNIPTHKIDQVPIMVFNIISVTLTILQNRGKNFEDIFKNEEDIYEKVARLESIKDIEAFLKNLMIQVINYLEKMNQKRPTKLIEDAKRYINENIGDSELTLKTLATYLYVNDSYLSRTFKKALGESVIEYITKKRIEKSIEFLNTTDWKAYEIAEKVGINDAHYFGICFKKYTGVTIKEYKNKKV